MRWSWNAQTTILLNFKELKMNAINPAQRPITIPKGSVIHTPSYANNYAKGTNFFKHDYRLVERNKYAPWGRQAY